MENKLTYKHYSDANYDNIQNYKDCENFPVQR